MFKKYNIDLDENDEFILHTNSIGSCHYLDECEAAKLFGDKDTNWSLDAILHHLEIY